jgi:hypothetical protein
MEAMTQLRNQNFEFQFLIVDLQSSESTPRPEHDVVGLMVTPDSKLRCSHHPPGCFLGSLISMPVLIFAKGDHPVPFLPSADQQVSSQRECKWRSRANLVRRGLKRDETERREAP